MADNNHADVMSMPFERAIDELKSIIKNTLDWFRNIPTVFTIHNLMHQGKTTLGRLQLSRLVDASPGP